MDSALNDVVLAPRGQAAQATFSALLASGGVLEEAMEAGVACARIAVEGVIAIARRHADGSQDLIVDAADTARFLDRVERRWGLGSADLFTCTVADALFG
jgi:hypothetical protein